MPASALCPNGEPLGQTPAALLLGFVSILAVGARPLLAVCLYLAAVSACLAETDVVNRRLPNAIVWPGWQLALAVVAVEGWLGRGPSGALLVGCACLAATLALSLAGGLGMGDVKLAGLLAFVIGGLDPAAGLLFAGIAIFSGGIEASLVLLRGAGAVVGSKVVARRATHIPFGPHLLIGFWVAVALTGSLS